MDMLIVIDPSDTNTSVKTGIGTLAIMSKKPSITSNDKQNIVTAIQTKFQ